MMRSAMAMQILTKCGRCGAPIEFKHAKSPFGESVRRVPCVLVSSVSTDVTVTTDGGELTALCPDCIGQLKAWLAGESEEQRKPQASTDSAGKLVRDMAKVFCCMHAGTQPFACWYFDHVKCDGCPAHGYDHGCDQEMYNDIGRRASALGINLVGGTEDEK